MFFRNGVAVERGETTVTSGGTKTLLADSPRRQRFTGVSTHILKLPNATTMKQGLPFDVINDSTGAIEIQNNGSTPIGSVPAGAMRTIVCRDISSANGVFDISTGSGGGGGVSAADQGFIRSLGVNTFAKETTRITRSTKDPVGSDSFATRRTHPSNIGALVALSAGGYRSFVGGLTPAVSTHLGYDPEAQYFFFRTAFPAVVSSIIGIEYQSNGYTFGNTDGPASRVYQYDAVGNAWSPKALEGSTTWNGMGGDVVSGRFFFGAGTRDSSIIDTYKAYDFVTDSYIDREPSRTLARARGRLLDGYFYQVSGRDSSFAYINTVKSYDPVKNSWDLVQDSMPASLDEGGVYSIGGLLGHMGGENPAGSANAVASHYVYNSAIKGWTTAKQLPSARSDLRGSIYGYVSSVNVVGGALSGSYNNNNWEYIPFNWMALPIFKRTVKVPSDIVGYFNFPGNFSELPIQLKTSTDQWLSLPKGKSLSRTGRTLKKILKEYPEVYADGGAGGLTSMEKYSAESNSWSVSGTGFTSQSATGGAMFDGYGFRLPQEAALGFGANQVGRYNPFTRTFTTLGATTPIAGIYSSVFSTEYLYATGFYQPTTTKDTYRFDPTTLAFLARSQYAGTARSGHAGTTLDGKGWLVGGTTNGTPGGNLATTNEYDDIADSWATQGNLAMGSSFAQYTQISAVEGILQVLGGTGFSTTTAVDEMNPVTRTWSSAGNLVNSRAAGSATPNYGFTFLFADAYGTASTTCERWSPLARAGITRAALGAARGFCTQGFSSGVERRYEMRIGLPWAYFLTSELGHWSVVANDLLARNHSNSFMLDFPYTYGGTNSGGTVIDIMTRYDEEANVHHYDSESGVALGGFSGHRWPCTFSLEGHGYALSGQKEGPSTWSAVLRYNPIPKTFTDMVVVVPVASSGTNFGLTLNEYGYYSHYDSSSMQRYSPAENSFLSRAWFTNRDFNPQGALMGYGYSFTASSLGGSFGEFRRYNDQADAWTSMATALFSVGGLSAGMFVLNGHFHQNAGVDTGGGYTAVCSRYNPVGNFWQRVQNYPQLARPNSWGLVSYKRDAGYSFTGDVAGTRISNCYKFNAKNLNEVLTIGAALEVTEA